ncbi:putative polyhydroxyalkanoic acid system protein [Posidoniimonas polymericola]|uniref:Putative polyhydroxyalkanoic acid system protein n=1 Tax=Posidoniimonas polymericola TaxID=2528002 RepID=A0A5C5YSY6_9BACT|nr:polyhydroxyalkanoic acid system family protein [Posidoniimonas polymericola]TWT77767.1 putative polyhydroxyalkanoic acid system protein [Posidoniimonas polymericola]
MPRPVTVSVPHNLGQAEARRRIEDGFGQLQQQMTGGLGSMVSWQRHWEGDCLHFESGMLGQKLTGRLEILDDAVRMEIDLPEILAALADRISGKLRDAGRKLLEKK